MPKRKDKAPIEKEEDPASVREKALALAGLIRDSENLIVYTGAGISTSAKIPDFRGPTGVWTLMDEGKKPDFEVEFEEAAPTYTHMALVALQNAGILKYVASQNVDGLHLRSGIRPELLSELHGNVFLETCEQCGERYMRSFDVNTENNEDHYTGRNCVKRGCGGRLLDSIIDFGEDLPELDLRRAEEFSDRADVALCLGSSLTVTPACNLPLRSKGAEVVIVNLMETPLDGDASIRVFAKTDEFMRIVMEDLGIEVPEYVPAGRECPTIKLEYGNYVHDADVSGEYEYQFFLTGPDQAECDFIDRVECSYGIPGKKGRKAKAVTVKSLDKAVLTEQPFNFFATAELRGAQPVVEAVVHFKGYDLVPMTIRHKVSSKSEGVLYTQTVVLENHSDHFDESVSAGAGSVGTSTGGPASPAASSKRKRTGGSESGGRATDGKTRSKRPRKK